MKTNNKLSDDRLKDLFREMLLENPSVDFTKNLMFRIEKEAARQKIKKQWSSYGLIASGIVGILGIPALILYFLGFDSSIADMSVSFPDLFSVFKRLDIDPSLIMLGITILFLLMGDVLFRKLIRQRKENQLHHA